MDISIFFPSRPLKQTVAKCNPTINTRGAPLSKGSACSTNGKRYEAHIQNMCTQLKYKNNTPLCVSRETAGSSKNPDLVIQTDQGQQVFMEIKRGMVPDWGQSRLQKLEGTYVTASEIHNNILQSWQSHNKLYDGRDLPFLDKHLFYEDWCRMKQSFKDVYIDCSEHEISNFYRTKQVSYIQVYGKGLFHTGEDPCGFGVPYFSPKQRSRIRIKVHTKGDDTRSCKLSCTMSLQAMDLETSPWSLDEIAPPCLISRV